MWRIFVKEKWSANEKFFSLIISKTDKKVTMGKKCNFLTSSYFRCNFAVHKQKHKRNETDSDNRKRH